MGILVSGSHAEQTTYKGNQSPICKRLRSPGIQTGYRFLQSLKGLQIRAQEISAEEDKWLMDMDFTRMYGNRVNDGMIIFMQPDF
jgi:hypothetical protein